MTTIVTGAAGFIGFHVSTALLARGEKVIGIDSVNDYYDPRLKHARLAELAKFREFQFAKLDVSDKEGIFALFAANPDTRHVVHLAAQAGVRYSLVNPYAYIQSNVMGHVVMLEASRTLKRFEHFVYASSSSVYGLNDTVPFSVDDPVNQPASLYAATKRSDELISHAYAHLYKVPQTGLRFFTVYGPWGRPDMAAYIFATKILAGEPIEVFNNGEMWRDFTYIDDIVSGILAAVAHPPSGPRPWRVYNLGNNRSEKLTDYIAEIEKAIGKKAIITFKPLQPGDIARTAADIAASERDLGFRPTTSIYEGIPRFIAWLRSYQPQS
jgi:UDP-glucuronate 4-epimerase